MTCAPFAGAEDAWVTAAASSIQKYLNMGMVGVDIDYEFSSNSDRAGPDWISSMCKLIKVCTSNRATVMACTVA